MRILKAVVIIMGVVILVGTGVLFWSMYNLSSKSGGVPASAPEAVISLALPAGCDIADISASNNRLFVRSSCGPILVYDAGTLRLVATMTP